MTEQLWNFGGIEAGASEIHASVASAPTACSTRVRRRSRALQPVWGGTGSEAYQAVQMRWDATSAELNAALQNLAHDRQQRRFHHGAHRSRRDRNVLLTRWGTGWAAGQTGSPTACASHLMHTI